MGRNGSPDKPGKVEISEKMNQIRSRGDFTIAMFTTAMLPPDATTGNLIENSSGNQQTSDFNEKKSGNTVVAAVVSVLVTLATVAMVAGFLLWYRKNRKLPFVSCFKPEDPEELK